VHVARAERQQRQPDVRTPDEQSREHGEGVGPEALLVLADTDVGDGYLRVSTLARFEHDHGFFEFSQRPRIPAPALVDVTRSARPPGIW
jgi:hypothetical protein